MTKITLTDLSTLNSTIVTVTNDNNEVIEQAIENTLSLDGTSPNAMEAALDMNSNQILNLPEAVDATDPIRLGDLEGLVEDLIAEVATGPAGPPGGSIIGVGTTTITGGTNTRVLYDNAGILGEYTVSGSGTAVAMATTPTFTTSITTPRVTGGTSTTSTLTLKTTTGIGTTNADMIFQVGNNGATEAMRILNSDSVGS